MFTNKLFRDTVTDCLFCTDVDESALYISDDEGFHWRKVADAGEFSWIVDANGAVHVAYTQKDSDYPNSYH